jgi:salicylate hydroxylase
MASYATLTVDASPSSETFSKMATQEDDRRIDGQFHVGLCNAGIGGMAATITIAKAGAGVTALEAAPELGEIGAGIQIMPNVAQLLQEGGVDRVIGDNLTRSEKFNLRRKDGMKVGYTYLARVEKEVGHPWWLVQRSVSASSIIAVCHD